jgi:hypothetical protein
LIQSLQFGAIGKSFSTMIRPAATVLLGFCIGSTAGLAAEFPQAQITNGQVTAKFYLPDARNGFYRSTRFDWSGAFSSLQYQGHEFHGQWFDRIDPRVINFAHQGSEIVVGSCGALQGPVDEFQTPVGWNEAKPGGTFLKIGVGILRKTEGTYNRYFPYEIVNSGKWTVKKHKDSIEFQQELSDPALGYAYVYRKVIRLTKGKPEMVIERSLKNTGRLELKSSVYDHNFMAIDKQAPGPDFTIQFPFQVQGAPQQGKELTEVSGNQIAYKRVLAGEDEAVVFIKGFTDSINDTAITIENKKVGAGVKISGNRPIIREFLWSIRSVLAVEPYVAIDVQPGAEYTWNNTYEYYTMPAGR